MYESPDNYPHLYVDGTINWTMTYRRDSDIYSPYSGYFEKVTNEADSIAKLAPKWEVYRQHRTKKVAWVVSNCFTLNARLAYAKSLSEYIEVDIYGACSPNGLTCEGDKCFDMIAKNYKFVLAFENGHCKDYITEKFFRAMYYALVPIVYGGASKSDYSSIAPNHSYIDTRDFSSPKGKEN